VIAFAPGSEAHYSVFAAVAEREYIVDIAFSAGATTGLPGESVMVLRADDDGIVVCEYDSKTGPLRNSTYHIGYDEIRRLIIL
jgi:hypothetical protein